MSRKVVLGAVAAAGTAAFVFLIVVMALEGLQQAGLWAGPLAALAGIVAAVAAVWALAPQEAGRPVALRPPSEQGLTLAPEQKVVALPPEAEVALPPQVKLPEWVVDRPAELEEVVTALVDTRAVTVGITTGLYGAGGFGKTTLARMACADERVWQWFGGRVYLVTMGRDVRGAAIAAKVNDVIKLVTGGDASFTDPQLAGQHLGLALDAGPRRLLVLDDVWEAEQLTPFAQGGRGCARLVTTRVPGLVAGRGPSVLVDQMSDAQARALLTAGLPPLEETVIAGLLAVTGRWPLLLRLASKILADYARAAPDAPAQGVALLNRLRAGGPAVVDEVLGEDWRTLDVGQPQQRERAVRATIEASTGLLSGDDAQRFAELGIFAEDENVPFSLVARLWHVTAGLDELRATQVCKRLAQLALVSLVGGPDGGIALHDVIRDFLRNELGQHRLAWLNSSLLDAAAAGLPTADWLDLAECQAQVAWWELGQQDRYLWDHLIEHLRDAGRTGEAETIAGDLRWVGARLERFGPAAPAADLAVAGTPRAARLRVVLARTAHLLAPTEPTGAVVDVLHSRVADDMDWGSQVAALRTRGLGLRLVSRWLLPDLADPRLLRVLSGHMREVLAVAVAPDGSWLASGSYDGTVRIWDLATGRERAVLSGHTREVAAVAVAPDGSWLASGGRDRMVRIWDTATGLERAALSGHASDVTAVAVASDGSWLASGGPDGTVRIWDLATGRQRVVLSGHTDWVEAVAVAPDGSWLASGGRDGTVRIWDTATGRQRTVLSGHADWVAAVAVAPDGSWLASGGRDRMVRIWDTVTGQERAVLSGHTGRVAAAAVAPDGSWLASGSRDRTVRIWNAATGRERAVLGYVGSVKAVAGAPDGSWLASGGDDGPVRIWDTATGRERAALDAGSVKAVAGAPDGSWLVAGGFGRTMRILDTTTGDERAMLSSYPEEKEEEEQEKEIEIASRSEAVESVAVAPDGSWLASGGEHGIVRIWDTTTGRKRAELSGYSGRVVAVAVVHDGRWLAFSQYSTVRIWDMATGRERVVLSGHTGLVNAVAGAPDGSWLASAGDDGTVRIWDIATGRERAVLSGHTGSVNAVAAAPDGNWLASAGSDRTMRIWDSATGHTRALMRVDNDLTSCAWLGSDALVFGGVAGLYVFGFLTGKSPTVNWRAAAGAGLMR